MHPLQKQIEGLIYESYKETNEPGCAVLALMGDDNIFVSRGIADLDIGASITQSTTFRLASVAKQFTAASILQLRDGGLLRLTQTVSDFFPGFADYGNLVELEHLLRHTSGIRDYERLIGDEQTDPVTDKEIVTMLSEQDGGDFGPGERFRYSNSGYAILAMVVEAVSGLSYQDYLKEHIFTLAGMTSALAYIDKPGLPQPTNRAIGYKLNDDGEFVWADQNLTTAVLGDGGIYCSTEDYARWIRAYWSGRIISKQTVKEAWTPGRTISGEFVPYGYGWRMENMGDSWRPYHPGSTSGFRNGAIVDHQKNWAVLVLSNRCNGDAISLAGEIVKILRD